MNSSKFRFAIDRGGTFTDIYAELPEGRGSCVLKLLSEDPAHYPDAAREGIRRILERYTGEALDPRGFSAERIESIRMGTTLATNALLERRGAKAALLITQGFGDLLRIRSQDRPQLFALDVHLPALLYERVLEIPERVRLLTPEDCAFLPPQAQRGLTGEWLEVLAAPPLEEVRPALEMLLREGFESLAIVCMHAYTFPDHERQLGQLAAEVGFRHISLSSAVMPRVKIVARGETTVVDAYLNPRIQQYLQSFREGFTDRLAQTRLLFMQSDGGLAPAEQFFGSRAVLSGPAGGVVGYAQTTFDPQERCPVIGFDMGGTSTDVSRYGGHYEMIHESETAGVRLQAPQVHVVTVAAGGGSRLWFNNGMLAVGPESVGAHPGPVCYRQGGKLAITDANLFLGRLLPEYFPAIFGPQGDQPLDREATTQAFAELTAQINTQRQSQGAAPMTAEAIAEGFLQVANAVMVRPMREISVARGYDVREHRLACFGGAGGQHACAIAQMLGMREILIPRLAGVLSAYGLSLAEVVIERQEPCALVYQLHTQSLWQTRLEALTQQAREALQTQGFSPTQCEFQLYLNLRYEGTDTALMIRQPDNGEYLEEFRAQYRREFGFDLFPRAIWIDDLRVRGFGGASHPSHPPLLLPNTQAPRPIKRHACYLEGKWQMTPVFRLSDLGAGAEISGPALLIHETSTILIEPKCRASVLSSGDVKIEILAFQSAPRETALDPIRLAIFSHLFMSIAEQMGQTLQRTAISTNIKERHDFSCAIFDAQGGLVANAPHQPVHLGAMGEAVRQQMALQTEPLQSGDVWLTNHPIAGGSHLPDMTVITPVLSQGKPLFFVANRGHHADIGGISPGSMPPFSRKLTEEGACIKSFKLVRAGVFQEQALIDLLQAPASWTRLPGEAPLSGTRRLADNLSDLQAQVAANQKGILLLQEMIETHSLEVVQAYMQHIQQNAENAVRSRLRALVAEWPYPRVQAEDWLDDGSPIRLQITIDPLSGSAIFDFNGTGKEVWGNWNAPRAVTHSAILYALRCLIRQEIPLNQGCLAPITIEIESGSLLAPSEEAAVVGGNVLTSQRVVDVIFKAFGAVAASQGCMNNLTFGDEHFGYYETIGGGAGAGPSWAGASGIHTHMTNTRITDPEILERRYPVLLREFALRKGSGGRGLYSGGDGLIREIEFLKPLNVAILSERRVFAPYGLAGGQDGQRGANWLIRRDGRMLNLGGKNEVRVERGDRLRVETPGGGGYGKPQD